MLIRELCVEHRQLEAQGAQLLRIVAAEVPDPAAVAALRWQIAQALLDHCAREDRGVYDALIASGDASATALAWHYRQEHGAIGDRFGGYIADWPIDRVAREWEIFRAETHSVIAALVVRIEYEEAVLYVHADRVLRRRAA